MKYNISLSTLFMILLSSQVAYGMVPRSLGKIEKQIFLREVDRIGKKAALLQIQKTKDPKPLEGKFCGFTIYPCFVITSQFRPKSDDPLATLIFDTIARKEKEEGYIPEQIKKTNNNGCHITLPNNRIENYTQYWHKEDKIGKYIELQSKFTDKERLLNALSDIKTKCVESQEPEKALLPKESTKKRKLSDDNDIQKKQKTDHKS
ncbi:MAG TPA: hypothetical protein VKU36_01050 [Candidatus Babeliales bacterium]|nr:hypothetical protein [Candidatus Babeliales bacterium]